MASGGATNLQRRLKAEDFQPMLNPVGDAQAYFPLDNVGINTIEATLWANTAQVNAVSHSMGVTPASWSAIIRDTAATKTKALQITESSAPNNSVVGVFVTGYSVTDKISIGTKFTFFPPAT